MGEKALNYMLAFCAGFVFCLMSTTSEASIVNDPVALEAKLEEMRVLRMAKAEAREAYWAAYRALPEVQVKRERCSKVYSTKGVYRKCRMETRWEKDTSNFTLKQPTGGITP